MSVAHTLVVVPVYNEGASLAAVLRQLKLYAELDVLVVDDASTDDSREVAITCGVTVLPLPIKLGAWGAMQTGLRYAHRQGYQQVITMDGDGQHHSQEINSLLKACHFHPEADVVIGACLSRGSRLRQVAWRFFRALTGIGIEDITSGFRLYNQRALVFLIRKEASLLEYQDVGVLLMLKATGMNIVETDVRMTPRQCGISRIYSSWFMVGYYMLVTTVLSISKVKRSKRAYRLQELPKL